MIFLRAGGVNCRMNCFRWLLILGALILFGCAKLPEQKNIWPWEYGQGQGEPNTGDHVAFRAGVTNFGEPPKAVKPVKPEPAEPQPTDVRPVAETAATKTEPPAVGEQSKEKVTSKKDGYDFSVREKQSLTAENLMPGTSSQEYDLVASNPQLDPSPLSPKAPVGETKEIL